MKRELRTFKVEVRKSKDGRTIRGTAVVFNQLSENLGGFCEQISPTAFDGCDMADVRALFNHNDDMVLGRTTAKTLALTCNASGLHFECSPPDTTYARDLAACMDRGDIDQCSFSFTVPAGGAEWKDLPDGSCTRTVKKISRLFDVSVVTYPAYTQTSSEIRSLADVLSEKPTAGDTSANSGAVDHDMLRRKLELAYYEHV